MAENVYDRINDYGSVKILLASPNDVRSWSFGEVRKPETINYRTYRPEKDGLFCERIFGPERDWECACGKYKGTKHKGIICDRCQVKVTHSRVRRKRTGHISLAAPIVHIWYFKALPSRLGTLLAMKTADLEKIVLFQDYVVVDPGQTPLKYQQVLTEDEYRSALETYGKDFKALMGADAIKTLLGALDLSVVAEELREGLEKTASKQKIKDLSKRLKMVESLRTSGNQPEWMVMDVIPVIPPDLRPLVLLESGNFATSDLNDLYRRIINRNNRLKKLMDLNAPEVIIRNEKRMLQQAVDSLFDNGRCRRPVQGTANRPLKSLTDMIKGKQGRFRENLLGKRVDYSGRSVIVVGPELRLHQCGLPKKIALELYQPFIIRKLKQRGLADTIKSAKKMLERRDREIWDILEEVIYQHPVMLNRAPTLHRMGIQAFEPVLVEGNAIKIHPLVCKGFNADFDGDQMAVHLPLSVEAQAETHVLMLATNNIFSPASGAPIAMPMQDIVLGCYYLTLGHGSAFVSSSVRTARFEGGLEHPVFHSMDEAITACELGRVGMHAPVVVRVRTGIDVVEEDQSYKADKGRILTTAGRCIFNDILPEGMPFYNIAISAKAASGVISDCHRILGRAHTIDLLDDIKTLGFHYSTLAGVSFGIADVTIPKDKGEILDRAQDRVDAVEADFRAGAITEGERYNQIVDVWIHAREEVTKALLEALRTDRREDDPNYLNPIWMMFHSNARGNIDQIRQLAGMRGLMSKPSGEIIEAPIKANFREGLTVLEYFSSTHGARKGLADTALKTADSGYLTRKLADVAQNVVITKIDCRTLKGIPKTAIYKGEQVDVPLAEMIVGRTARENIVNPLTDDVIVRENQIITKDAASKIEELGMESIRVRSSLTCESQVGCCATCYGVDMASGHMVEEGTAIGIIAAQSIGEPGTQLTMRTFHTGGVATRAVLDNEIVSGFSGTVLHRELNTVDAVGRKKQLIALKRNGEIAVLDPKGRELEKHKVPYGAFVLGMDGEKIKKGQRLVTWDPHRTPILAEANGVVRFQDIEEGETVRIDSEREGQRLVVIEHKGEKHPRIVLEDKSGKILDFHYLPSKAHIEVKEGQTVRAGHLLARQPREVAGTQDITGGLPRVTEVFEARKPKDPAAMAEISGRVELRTDKRRGKMTIIVRSGSGMEREHHVPHDRHLLVHTGDYVDAGDPLTEGPLVLHDILAIRGEEALQQYLLTEIQSVYRSQSVTLNDKHVEVILTQMLRRVAVDNVGDSDLLPSDVIDKVRFIEENARLRRSLRILAQGDTSLKEGSIVPKDEVEQANANAEAAGGEPAKTRRAKPATAKTLLLGITKASLQSESFLSAASFQESTKVFTEASLAGRVDELRGLKENVILGHLIPAGTSFKPYLDMEILHNVDFGELFGEEKSDVLTDDEIVRAVQKALSGQ
ncbi:MAG TPA: DNA-directed RNA polymerase subunit beta' [Phycisphaerae bacterium]|nr:DNA-directed RNA polymerase subunit beta' [Phycisphaerae bacterium]HDZ43686.1 DNA-directed RNA polymerase subunit beta' [Phycisphaerae bacterium]